MNCPNCKTEINEVFLKCPSCGLKLKAGGNIGCLKAFGIGAAVLVGLGIIGSMLPNPPKGAETAATAEISATEPAAPTLKATAKEIFRAYQSNEAAAQKQYGDRPVEVSGVISDITLDFSDDPVVSLATDNQFMAMQLQPDENSKAKAAGLKKGQKLTAVCADISEVVGTPMARDCSF